jgi:hypothetical protein
MVSAGRNWKRLIQSRGKIKLFHACALPSSVIWKQNKRLSILLGMFTCAATWGPTFRINPCFV